MIVVRVELVSAITGEATELARMQISNDGSGSPTRGNYDGVSFRGRDRTALDRQVPSKTGRVEGHPRQSLHVWHLVARMLKAAGYS